MNKIALAALFLVIAILSYVVGGKYWRPSHLKPITANEDPFLHDLIARMTLEEKAGQLGQATADMAITGPSGSPRFKEMVSSGQVGSILNSYGVKANQELQKHAVEDTRLKIPLLFGFDVVRGYRTTFPIPLAESASWNLELIEKSAHLAAKEAASDGIDWTYAPMVDVARDPRWGRVNEGAGEDPWWGSKVAAARVRGFQGRSPDDLESVLATAKHFAAYGAALGGRDYNSVDISERELLETYLPPFKAAVDAGVSSIMTSFNDIAGIPSTANRWLLTHVLREQWAFRGVVITDFTAIAELLNHGIAENEKEASNVAFAAGSEVDMESHYHSKHLPELVREGKISEDHLNQAVYRVLEMKKKRGLFEDPYRYMSEVRSANTLYAPEMREHAREIARRSIVLLKNEKQVLPISKKAKVAVIGPMQTVRFGDLSNEPQKRSITITEGIGAAVKDQGLMLAAIGAHLYPHPKLNDVNEARRLRQEAVSVARKADVLVLTLGEPEAYSGEAASRSQIRLPDNQIALIEALVPLKKPMVIVLSNGRPLVLDYENRVADALVESWYLGVEAGRAIADVLFGDYNPSGKLTMSFPRNEGQIPVFYSQRNTGRPSHPDSKWTSKYLDIPNTPLFPFGWGLSYSKFKISEPQLSSKNVVVGEPVTVRVTVENLGPADGTETVQIYLRKPVSSVAQPLMRLRGYEQVFLKVGERRDLEIQLSGEDLKHYDRELNWRAEEGKYLVMAGSHSGEVSAAEFTLIQ